MLATDRGGRMRYKLMASYNCGISYAPEAWGDTIEELSDAYQELEEQGMRWYIEEEDGEICKDVMCGIHKGILDFIDKLNEEKP